VFWDKKARASKHAQTELERGTHRVFSVTPFPQIGFSALREATTAPVIASDRRERGNLFKCKDLAGARLPRRFAPRNDVLGIYSAPLCDLNCVERY